MQTPFIGLDIGGANLKAANSLGQAVSVSFPLWKQPQALAEALVQLVAPLAPAPMWGVTMTGELADCFPTKTIGVHSIVTAVVQASAQTVPQPDVRLWTVSGDFITPSAMFPSDISSISDIAASNWAAQATWIARRFPDRSGLLVDIGSTTADLIPFQNGKVVAQGKTDVQRLTTGELVYTGARRTPLCALAPSLTFQGRPCRVAAELFATTQDVYLLLGDTPEDPTDSHTADGRAATVAHAQDRIARMLCCDRNEMSLHEARASARQFADAQMTLLDTAFRQVCPQATGKLFVTSGSGEFLAQRLIRQQHPDAEIRSLSEWHSPEIASAACAYAVACLLEDAQGGR